MNKLLVSLLFVIVSFGTTTAQDVVTGPSSLSRSEIISRYMRGAADVKADPVAFRILGVRSSTAGIAIEGIVLDANGNALGTDMLGGSWSADIGCRGEALKQGAQPIVEQLQWTSATASSNVAVFVDHSLTSAEAAPEIVRELRNVLPSVTGNDSISVAIFDHNMLQLSGLAPVYEAAERCNADSLGASKGIPAVYTAMMSGLRVLSDRTTESKILVIVTASNDMASLMYTSSDIVRRAREAGVTIHVVKVGTAAQGYVYRYIAASTGGRMYTVDRENAADAAHIVREIMYSAKQRLELFIPMRRQDVVCDDLLLRVRYDDGITELADTVLLPIRERSFRTPRAVVAAYADTTERGLQDYYPILAVLAEDLMTDSTKRLQLVGHVSTDTKGDGLERGLERAGYVRDFLIGYGVKGEQISVRSDGKRKPMYYLQLDGTQRLLNNRVEAYYLLPDDLPYTITVDNVSSEEQAEAAVNTWTSRGYKAYFDVAIEKRSPVYQVKLWGYATRGDALNAVAQIKKKHNTTCVVE